MKIKVLEKTEGCFPYKFSQGDWFDLVLAEGLELDAPIATRLYRRKNKETKEVEKPRDVEFQYCIAKLGVCMELPKGYEAIVAPRSSTFKKWGVLMNNSLGIIDNSYNSDEDEWGMPVVATRKVFIPKHTRIAQFRIQLSQNATMWQKIKWLFSSKVEFEKVESLGNTKRGGFGSTGEK